MKKEKLINIIMAMITTIAMMVNYEKLYASGLKLIHHAINVSPLITAIIVIAIACFYQKFNKKEYRTNWLQNLFSIFFAVTMVVGKSFEITNSFQLITKSKVMVLVSIFALIGYFFFFKIVFQFLNCKLNKIKLNKIQFKRNNKLIQLFDNHPFACSFIVMFVVYGIYIVVFYPGVLNYDTCYEILQAFNIHTKYADWVIQLDSNVNITNHHPVLYTLFVGTCMKLGRAVLNDNFGIFIATMIQTIIYTSTLAYTIQYLKKIGISSKIRAIVLGIYCFVPMFPFYAITNVKDTIYTSLLILYIIRLYDYIRYYKEEKLPVKNLVWWIFLMVMIVLLRNNGIYVVVLSFIFIMFYSKKNIKYMLIALLLVISFNEIYTKILLPYYKIPNTSTREMLSVPFQQTARYVKTYPNEVTDHEKKVIDTILGYDTLSERYKPGLADPVKNKYNKYTTKEELKEYFKVWANGLIKHPSCYVEAFLNNTYAYFYPSNNKWYIYHKELKTINKKGNFNYHYIEKMRPARKILITYGKGFRSIPVIGFISNIGFNTCIILVYSVYLIMQKGKRKYLMMLLPHLITLLFCLVSPVNNYFRYAMPYIFALPMTTIFWLKEITEKGETKNGEK